ncbi:MAG TPA: hypothetical protein VNI84_20470, partial [Pyrinomonadaceae bacterium]|nr:hypothetical protein [Pyrinomonadaceae bacterium]
MADIAKRKIIYKDGFRVNTEIEVPFIDRVRILFGGRFAVTTEIQCERDAGRTQTGSTFIVEKIFPEHVRNSLKFFNFLIRKVA